MHRFIALLLTGTLANPAQPTPPPLVVEGVVRPGDPYGGPTDVVAGLRVALWHGRDPTSCRGPMAAVGASDSVGRFRLEAARPSGAARERWVVCLQAVPSSVLWIPAYVLPAATLRAARPRASVECKIHGDSGSPECTRPPAREAT